MSSKIIFKKFSLYDNNKEEIGAVTLEHLWADVFGLRIKRTEKATLAIQWQSAFQEALLQAHIFNARQVVFRLVKDKDSEEIGRLLPELGFEKKNERVEYKKQLMSYLGTEIHQSFGNLLRNYTGVIKKSRTL